MKKLISVFAALAIVGSLAAQKGKKAPAKPAAPAVAAPKAPAMPAVVTAAPAAVGAAKGLGLFIDARGTYTISNGSSSTAADGTTASTATADPVTYKTSAAQGFGGGVSIGYNIVSGLGIVASYDIRQIKTREFSGRVYDYFDLSAPGTSQAGGGGNTQEAGAAGVSGYTTTGTLQQKWTNQVIGLGLRPNVNALGGQVYAGAGVAFVLPFETTTTLTLAAAGTNWNAASGNATKGTIVKGYNMAIGAYAEMGYKFFFTDNIGLDIGIRALVATADNKDKTKVQTTNGDGTGSAVVVTKTTTYSDSVSLTDKQTVGTVASGSQTLKSQYETLGITDFSATVGISLKF